jgi:predicted dehydrogenase
MVEEAEMGALKLGIIGTGIAARDLHAPALRELGDKFDVVAVCNRTKEKAEAFAKLMGAERVYSDYGEMLEKEGLDAVSILLPIELNYAACERAARAGVHVMVEKPLAKDRKEARKMLRLEAAHPGKVFMVAENYRYRNAFAKMKELIDGFHIGKPYAFQWNAFQKLTADNKYARTSWRIDHQYEGGFVTDAGVHNIAALRDLLGELKPLGGHKRSLNPEIGRMDTLVACFAMEGGGRGVFNSFFSAHGPSSSELRIFGDLGTLLLKDSRLILYSGEKSVSEEDFGEDNGYKGEYEDFYKAIANGGKPKSSFAQAERDLDTILTAIDKASWV